MPFTGSMKRSFGLPLIFLFLIGCASYRGIGEFHGPGTFVTAPPASSPHSRLGRSGPSAKGPFRLQWPLKVVRINQNFHSAHNPRHEGVDLGGRFRTPIYAAHEGTVIYTGHGFHGYGNMVMIEYNRHWATLYAHMNRILAKQGSYVHAGDEIGLMGRTGHATGVHLHFELIKDKQPVNPLLYLPPRSRWASTH